MSGPPEPRPPIARSLAFPVSEYRRRLAKAEAGVDAARLDALLTTITANICWLTGFQTIASYSFALFAALVRPGREPVLISSDFESHNALIDAWIDDVRTYGVMDDPIEAVAGLLRSVGLDHGRIGIETGHGAMTIGQIDQLRELVPGATFVDASGVAERARAVKSALELDALREAGRIASVGMAAALATVAPGVTDNDVADAVIRAGGEHFAIVPIVTAGRRSGIPHTSFRRNRLEPGDPVFIEVCGTYLRYSAAMLRTASLGEPAPDVRRAFEACLASVETLLREVRAGIPASTVARAAGAAMRAIEPNPDLARLLRRLDRSQLHAHLF